MTNNRDFNRAVEKTVTFLEDIGDTKVITEEKDQRTKITVGSHDDAEFRIIAPQDTRYFRIQYRYNLYRDLISQFSQEDAIAYLEEATPPNTSINETDVKKQAAKHILTNLEKEDQKVILFHLVEAFANSNVNFRITGFGDANEEELGEVLISYKIFPYEDDFSIRVFNDGIEEVRSAGRLGERYLRYIFNLGVDDERNLGGDVTESRFTP